MRLKQEQIFELEQLLRMVYRKLKQDIHTIFKKEISHGEYTVLKLLSKDTSLKATDLSKNLKVSASHITMVTDSLVKKGFLTRTRSDVDRRVVDMVVTDEGKELLKHFNEKRSDYFYEKLNQFSDEEIEEFMRLLNKLKD
ncbi:MarR family winged helix-turn-helix transcriptional regulator [Cytobacillus sp. Hz8]|uniref:MarR family winged helix-turn-helix transcriptional regulator n=1 Tax=Cytobacillus sp. Hz8 TaxID=3347168 RepID=UPI0035DFC745